MMWTYRLRASFQRSNSHDKVRKIVAEEGRAARNLIAWSVPLETKEEEGKQSKISSKAHRTVPGQQRSKKNAGGDGKSTSALLDKGVEKSPSKGRQPRKVDLRARYWAFLFENLRRAVDEIYVTCESDQSVVECREVLMMLDNYVRDFKALIDWIQLQEKLENTDAQNRPTSLAWEVRKMSPGRHVMASPSADRMVPSPGARRALTFGGPPTARLSHTGPSWADRVKCSQSLPHSTKKDAEGWETVHRGRPAKPRSATMIAKVSPVVAQVPPKADHPKPKASQPPLKEPEATQGLCQPEQDPHPPQQDLPNELQAIEHLSLKKYIVDIVPDTCVTSESVKDGEERQKARKKAKKLRARMNSRAKEYETSLEAKAQVSDSPYKAKLQRLVRDLLKQLQGQDSGQWSSSRVSALDRTLGEISRILEKQNNADQVSFQMGGGLLALEQILQVITAASTPSTVPRIPVKSLCAAVNTYYLTCASCSPNCSYVLFGNKITLLMDLLLHQLTLYVPDEDKTIFGRSVNKLVFEGLTTGLLQTISSILSSLWPPISESGERISSPDVKTKSSATEAFNTRTQDLISYVVNVGLIDKLYGCFLSVQTPVDDCPKMSSFLREASALLHSLCKLCFVVTGRAPNIFDNKRQDPTGLSSLLQSTDLVGVVHTLYSILLHTFPESSTQSHEPYSPGVIQVALHGIRFLNSFALLDLPAFQSVLGAEGLSLAFRHIVSSLLWYCSQHSSQALLHEVIICVGYFTVNHPDNQGIVQSGDSPVCCRSSVNCPSSTSVTQVILQHEMSCVLLATFIQLSNRFPRDQWDSALKFFLQKQEQS
uniref:S-phase cyclin A-associated protein in the ER n=1 Tax=Neogobius melanostomus TaxID=47308 RepID=A0A8C6TGY2_9GOBI